MTTKDRTGNSQNNLNCKGIKGWKPNGRRTNLFIGIFASFPVTLALPVDALQVQVTPSNPHIRGYSVCGN